MAIIVKFLLLVASVGAVLAETQVPIYTSADVCLNKVPKVIALSQIDALDISSDCELEGPAVADLKKVIFLNQHDHVCGQGSSFYFEELKRSYKDCAVNRDNSVVRQFGDALAFEISAHCKANLMKQMDLIKNGFDYVDMKPINDLVSIGAGMFDEETTSASLDGTDLIQVAAKVLRSIRSGRASTLISGQNIVPDVVADHTHQETKNMLQKARNYCVNKYADIYKRIFLPIMRLSDMGYDYSVNGPLLAGLQINDNATLKLWLNGLILCEAVGAYDQDSEEGWKTVNKIVKINDKPLSAEPLADVLTIDPLDDLPNVIKESHISDSMAADHWEMLYHKVIGREASIILRKFKSDAKFFQGYMNLIIARHAGNYY